MARSKPIIVGGIWGYYSLQVGQGYSNFIILPYISANSVKC